MRQPHQRHHALNAVQALNEIAHITTQKSTTAKTNFGCAAEDVVSINTQVRIGDRIHACWQWPYPSPNRT